MTNEEITVTLSAQQVLTLGEALHIATLAGSSAEEFTFSLSSQRLRDLGKTLRAAGFAMSDINETKKANMYGALLTHIEQWPTKLLVQLKVSIQNIPTSSLPLTPRKSIQRGLIRQGCSRNPCPDVPQVKLNPSPFNASNEP